MDFAQGWAHSEASSVADLTLPSLLQLTQGLVKNWAWANVTREKKINKEKIAGVPGIFHI